MAVIGTDGAKTTNSIAKLALTVAIKDMGRKRRQDFTEKKEIYHTKIILPDVTEAEGYIIDGLTYFNGQRVPDGTVVFTDDGIYMKINGTGVRVEQVSIITPKKVATGYLTPDGETYYAGDKSLKKDGAVIKASSVTYMMINGLLVKVTEVPVTTNKGKPAIGYLTPSGITYYPGAFRLEAGAEVTTSGGVFRMQEDGKGVKIKSVPSEIISLIVTPNPGKTTDEFTVNVNTSNEAEKLTLRFDGNPNLYEMTKVNETNWTWSSSNILSGNRTVTATSYNDNDPADVRNLEQKFTVDAVADGMYDLESAFKIEKDPPDNDYFNSLSDREKIVFAAYWFLQNGREYYFYSQDGSVRTIPKKFEIKENKAMDCSSFVSGMYTIAGKNLAMTSGDMGSSGSFNTIKWFEAQPGDIVVTKTKGHVRLIVGIDVGSELLETIEVGRASSTQLSKKIEDNNYPALFYTSAKVLRPNAMYIGLSRKSYKLNKNDGSIPANGKIDKNGDDDTRNYIVRSYKGIKDWEVAEVIEKDGI